MNIETALMPAHTVPSSLGDTVPCRAVQIGGYVHVQDDGRWHCNRCGYVCDAPEDGKDPEQFGISAAAGFLVAIESDPGIGELERIMARTLWSVLTGLSDDEGVAYAQRLTEQTRATIAVIPPL